MGMAGDMALLGYPLVGHLVAHRGGHALHTAFAAHVLEDVNAWTLVESVDPVPSDDAPAPLPIEGAYRAVN